MAGELRAVRVEVRVIGSLSSSSRDLTSLTLSSLIKVV